MFARPSLRSFTRSGASRFSFQWSLTVQPVVARSVVSALSSRASSVRLFSTQRSPALVRPTPCGLWVDHALPPTFKKILIANRGEIACRVIRTCKELGIRTVAVFSDADADAMHVQMADEAYRIGEPEASKSYLLGEKILDVAKQSGAEAIHPGYGFLSENEQFAQLCQERGVKFLGPPASAIRSMGSKSASKNIMTAAGVPVVPGYHGEAQDIETLMAEADRVGYPIMIKAVLGGGGKGMRIVEKKEDFDEMLDACQREAKNSFKDDRVLLERYIVRPRHIEFQVFADEHGNAVHLYERDCSVQRRHQKVLEEAPAPGMTPELRAKMGQSAVDAAKAVGYVGAGTVEFIFDADTGEYFFMEMNTRLQVEHPVSEMIMRKDLVQWQLHVGAGHTLPYKQSDLVAFGHAIEARVYAENPRNNFLPVTGKLVHLQPPPAASDIRVETGVRQDDTVSSFYDPMISKLVVWAQDRPAALRRLANALRDYQIVGPLTNVAFCIECAQHPAFQKGQVDTSFIKVNLATLLPETKVSQDAAILATLHLLLQEQLQHQQASKQSADPFSPWDQPTNYRPNIADTRSVRLLLSAPTHLPDDPPPKALKLDFKTERPSVGSPDQDQWTFTFPDGKSVRTRAHLLPPAPAHPSSQGVRRQTASSSTSTSRLAAVVGDRKFNATVVQHESSLHIFCGGEHHQFHLPVAKYGQAEVVLDSITAPLSGKIASILVEAGAQVKKGQTLVVIESMKMMTQLKAGKDREVATVLFKQGDLVNGGDNIIVFKEEPKSPKKPSGKK